MAYFLTFDGGTESLRARIYDLSGACLGSQAVPYQTKFSAGAQAEQDPSDWWDAVVIIYKRVHALASVLSEDFLLLEIMTA